MSINVETVGPFVAHPFLGFIGEHGQTLEQAAAARQAAASDHNRRETPEYAESVARAARASETALT
jgi:hypothetical protein